MQKVKFMIPLLFRKLIREINTSFKMGAYVCLAYSENQQICRQDKFEDTKGV